MKKRIPTLGGDGNGGATLNFPSTKPGALLMWIGGSGVVTVIIVVISLTYAFGKKTESFYRDISQNTKIITEVVSEVSLLKIDIDTLRETQINDLRAVTAAIFGIEKSTGVMANDLDWIKKELVKISVKADLSP